jgi:hypothetical protein
MLRTRLRYLRAWQAKNSEGSTTVPQQQMLDHARREALPFD